MDDSSYTRKLSTKYYYLDPIDPLPLIGRIGLNVFTLSINTPWVIYRRAGQIGRVLRGEKCKLLIGCSGDLYDLPAACLASWFTNVPFVPYLFDDYANQWTGFYRSIAKWLEPQIIKRAKGIIVPNEYLKNEYKARYGVNSTVINNPTFLPDLEDLDRRNKIFNDQDINIVYTGAIYHAHYDAFHNLIDAIGRVKREDVKLHIYTAQPESELRQVGIEGGMIEYHPHVKDTEVPRVLRQADILFLPLAFNSPIPEVIKTSAPGKTGEYLAVGRPIIVHAPEDTFISRFFKTNGCGVVVDKRDPKLLAEQIGRLISNEEVGKEMSGAARRVAESVFSVDKMKNIFFGLINSF
jgi:glycosyltransferase involved in cell wall biosynthesis